MKVINIALSFLFIVLLSSCEKKITSQNASAVTISYEENFETLDPRQIRSLASITPIQMLYEGLFRSNGQEQPALGIAESYTISSDKKTYVFKLRPSLWSNGDQVTAKDFEESWKAVLEPKFASPNAYQLYVIRDAKNAKEGKKKISEIGVKVLDDYTLQVDLERPTPYFLQLLTTHFFYPLHSTQRENKKDVEFISNGPFKLKDWSHHHELSLVANPHYWDQKAVRLQEINVAYLDNFVALKLYENNELDWVGSPISTLPIDSLEYLKKKLQLKVAPAASTYFVRLNIANIPLNSRKLRQALAYAIDREKLVNYVLQGNQIPAYGLIPPSFLAETPLFQNHDVARANTLLQKVLQENGWTLKDIPKITLCYAQGERPQKIAQVIQQQIKAALNIEIELQSLESKLVFAKLKKHDYQMCLGSWFADFHDPISFLDVFKQKENGTNNTQWENPKYQALIDKSFEETDFNDRAALLKQAEAVLIHDMPIIPLFHSSFNYVKNSQLRGVYFSDLGYLDFKHAYKEN